MRAIQNKKVITEIKTVIEKYAGGEILDIEVYPDPHNSRCYAVRCKFPAQFVDFLLTKINGEFTEDSVEEASFESWPPMADKKNMVKLENMWASTLSL